MKIMVARHKLIHKGKPVETYSASMVRVLQDLGHDVVETEKNPNVDYTGIDLLIDVDCGRNEKGQLIWQCDSGKPKVNSAVLFIDTHGNPTLHRRLSRNYNHVFFAVWAKRDVFANHSSAHWCPNFTDTRWFDGAQYPDPDPKTGYDFGFFGSKGGLSRANKMLEYAEKHGWKATARQVGKQYRHQWPYTAEAMAECRNLFNHQQKHDGPNLRVMESMLMLRPLICDRDPQSGMDKLFTPYEHYIPYESYTYDGLEEKMKWVMEHRSEVSKIALNAYLEVRNNHLVEHRIKQILEVCNG